VQDADVLAEVADMGDALCSYDCAAEGFGMQVMQAALDNLVIHGGGNDQRDIEIAVLPKLLPDNLCID
jgi:hypothetical protein